MKKIFFAVILGALLPCFAHAATSTEKISLSVPFIIEIPDGTWTGNWKNACEEASMSMVDQYYAGVTKISRQASKNIMNPLFTYQDSIWGGNADSNATRTAKIIEAKLDFKATIKRNPTIEEIKNELRAGRPVISFHYAKYLANPGHRFRVGGSYYHVMVISGFDDATGEFITEDPGAENGLDYRYKYDTLMATLGDFNHTTKKVDGPATVIFTKQYLLAKAEGGKRIYLLNDNTRQYICSPDLFKKYGWSWSKVRTVNKTWLSSMATGTAIWE
ncbi:MAG: C39 family peptidase [Patescibacteria group bacterium]